MWANCQRKQQRQSVQKTWFALEKLLFQSNICISSYAHVARNCFKFWQHFKSLMSKKPHQQFFFSKLYEFTMSWETWYFTAIE